MKEKTTRKLFGALSVAALLVFATARVIAHAEEAQAQEQSQATATPEAAAAPTAGATEAPAAPKFDTGDTAWMLTSTALVLMMTIPGLFLFYGGLVRSKNVLSTIMHSFFCAALDQRDLGAVRLLARLRARRRRLDRRPRLRRDERHPRDGERARADDPADPVRRLPGDVRDHHAGPHLRHLRRAHQLPGLRALHAALVDLRLLPDSPTGCGAAAGSARRSARSTSPAAPSSTSRAASRRS